MIADDPNQNKITILRGNGRHETIFYDNSKVPAVQEPQPEPEPTPAPDATAPQFMKAQSVLSATLDAIKADDYARSTVDQYVTSPNLDPAPVISNLSDAFTGVLQQERYRQFPTLAAQQKANLSSLQYQYNQELSSLRNEKVVARNLDEMSKLFETYREQNKMYPDRTELFKQKLQAAANSLVQVVPNPDKLMSGMQQMFAQLDADQLQIKSKDNPLGTLQDFNNNVDYYKKAYGDVFVAENMRDLSVRAQSYMTKFAKQMPQIESALQEGEPVDLTDINQMTAGTELAPAAQRLSRQANLSLQFRALRIDQIEQLSARDDDVGQFAQARLEAIRKDPIKIAQNLGHLPELGKLNYMNPQTFAQRYMDVESASDVMGMKLPFMTAAERSNLDKALDSKSLPQALEVVSNLLKPLEPNNQRRLASEIRNNLSGDKAELAYLSALEPKMLQYVKRWEAATPEDRAALSPTLVRRKLRQAFPELDVKQYGGRVKAVQAYLLANQLSADDIDVAIDDVYGRVDNDAFGVVSTGLPGASGYLKDTFNKLEDDPAYFYTKLNGKPVYADGSDFDLDDGETKLEPTKSFGRFYLRQNGKYVGTANGTKAVIDLSEDFNGYLQTKLNNR
jgi:hypothetical protein